jgi:hypothetical protein
LDRVEKQFDLTKDWVEGGKKQLIQAAGYASKARKVRFWKAII